MREALVTLSESEFASLGIEELVDLCRAAGIREFDALACEGDSAVVQVEVETDLEEERLGSLAYVDRWRHVVESDDAHLYVIAFSVPGLSEDLADRVEELVGTCDPEMTDRGATVSLVGPHETIAETLSEYRRDGITPDLRKFVDYEGVERPLDRLTDRQREVIRTAYEMGYYEVPREASTGEVATELDVDSSTVAEHLQRAERNLLSYHLSSE